MKPFGNDSFGAVWRIALQSGQNSIAFMEKHRCIAKSLNQADSSHRSTTAIVTRSVGARFRRVET
jgi:hypothetical protein